MKGSRSAFHLIAPAGIIAGLLLSGPASSQQQQPGMGTTSTVIQSTFVSGAGSKYLRFSVSTCGNIVQLEAPVGYEHIWVSDIREGYGIGFNGAVTAFDVGNPQAGFGGPIIVQPGGPNTFPLTITRNTTDGKLQLKQVFTRNTSERFVIIKMTVKNISPAPLANVMLYRLADFDISGDVFDDNYDRSVDTVWARDDLNGPAAILLHANSTLPHDSMVTNYGGDASLFFPPALTTPALTGDYEGRVTYSLGTLNKGSSKTVEVRYEVR